MALGEAKNKAKIMMLVQNLHSYMDAEGKTPIQTIVEKCYAQGSFPALWAIEGAGKDIAEWHMARNENPAGILTNLSLDEKWNGAGLMLHAGSGMGYAKFYMDKLKSGYTDADVTHLVRRAVDLCRANSQEGYYGAAIESLGLVSRFMQDNAFCRKIHTALMEYAPDSVGFYWRGVGRSVYFSPLNFLPGFVRPCRAIKMCEDEAPNLEMKETMLAGVAWAFLQPWRVTLLHPHGQGFWWLVLEPPLLVAAAGVIFALVVARPLLSDLEAHDAAPR